VSWLTQSDPRADVGAQIAATRFACSSSGLQIVNNRTEACADRLNNGTSVSYFPDFFRAAL